MDKENWDTKGLVTVISAPDIIETQLNEMRQAGDNPYVVLGLLEPAKATNS